MSAEGLKAGAGLGARRGARRLLNGAGELLSIEVGPMSVSMQNRADPWYERFRLYDPLPSPVPAASPEPDPRVCIFMSIPSRTRSYGKGSFHITAFYRPNSDMFRLYESSVKCFLELPSLVSPEEIAYLNLPEDGLWIQTQWELVRQMKHAQNDPEGWESLHRPPYGRIDRTR